LENDEKIIAAKSKKPKKTRLTGEMFMRIKAMEDAAKEAEELKQA